MRLYERIALMASCRASATVNAFPSLAIALLRGGHRNPHRFS